MVERGRAAGEGKVVGQGESRGRIAGGDICQNLAYYQLLFGWLLLYWVVLLGH